MAKPFLRTNKWTILAVVALLGCAYYYWNFIREPDWRSSAIEDVAFIREVLRADHPGAMDADNPQFLPTLESAHARAAALAEMVDSPAGYFYAVRATTMPFEDAHLVPQFFRPLPRVRQWPGFFVSLNGQGEISVKRRVIDGAPPVGASLVACDDNTPEELYRQRVAPFQFRSWLPALKPGDWPWILIDSGNPFVQNPESCDFRTDDGIETYTLEWQPLEASLLSEFNDLIEPATSQTTELRFEGDGIAWISIASFFDSGETVSEDLARLIDSIGERRTAIEHANSLVLDVRGNLGGASASGYAVAEALWGEGFIADRIPRFTRTDWRASDNNLDRIKSAILPLRIRFGADSELFRAVAEIRDGMQRANEAGEPFFEQDQPTPTRTSAAPQLLPEKIYFLTDQDCVSACLDFADLMKSIDGVRHIGRETSGDTLYLEVATAKLPSGIGQLVYPTAIHRGRDRGINASYRPDLPFQGNISDTAAIVRWLESGKGLQEGSRVTE